MLQLESREHTAHNWKWTRMKKNIFFKFLKAMRIEEPLLSEAGKSWHESEHATANLREIQKVSWIRSKAEGIQMQDWSQRHMTEKAKLNKVLRLQGEICNLFESRLEWQQLEKGRHYSKIKTNKNRTGQL